VIFSAPQMVMANSTTALFPSEFEAFTKNDCLKFGVRFKTNFNEGGEDLIMIV
jgi:hypothetical protein